MILEYDSVALNPHCADCIVFNLNAFTGGYTLKNRCLVSSQVIVIISKVTNATR